GVDGPVLEEASSDSGMLDNALELLVRGGRDARHALTMLIPPAWQGDVELDPEVRDFHRFHAGLVEPWDGPAGIVFTDGWVVGAALDRNGLRPLRYVVAGDLVCCASEAGVFDVPAGPRARRGRLGAGGPAAPRPWARPVFLGGGRPGAAAARRACTAALQLLPPAVRAGDESRDRPHPRAVRDVARHVAWRARPAARGVTRGSGGHRAREL